MKKEQTIKLTKGQFAIVDDCKYNELNQYSWQARLSNATKSYCAVRNSPRLLGKQKKKTMDAQGGKKYSKRNDLRPH